MSVTKYQTQIKQALMSDLESIFKIESEVHITPWTQSMLGESLTGSDLVFKLLIKNEIIGYMVLMTVLDEMELINIAISKKYQGLGYAQLLIKFLLDYANNNHVNRIFLEVRESNIAALKLYQKFGFAQIAVRKNYYLKPVSEQGQNYENALIMQFSV